MRLVSPITCNRTVGLVSAVEFSLSIFTHTALLLQAFFYSCFFPTYSPLFRYLVYRSVRHTENHTLTDRWVTNTPSVKIMFSLYFRTNINASLLVFKGYAEFLCPPYRIVWVDYDKLLFHELYGR